MGFLFAPTRVQTLRSLWLRPSAPAALEPAFGAQGSRLARLAGLLLLFAVYAVLWTSASRPGPEPAPDWPTGER